ncbi:hypothetical protein [Acetivibrio cellulolyticus]|uniref:hypothetical protein n=1 Tax=Acetivibrio cellulolyticus TaxID=35830 RepID=UPI0001E2EB8B|nr:hypothetical protein [Acetivibrio cellulolyticus]
MNNWIRIPGFPPPEKQSSVRFYVFKSLSYSTRMMLYLLLIAAGFLFQVLMLKVWPGAVFLICATVLNLVRGYDSRVRLNAFHIDSNWTQVDMERIHQIEELDSKTTKWDKDILDISNGRGSYMFVFIVMVIIITASLFGSSPAYGTVVKIIITDIIILILPLWFNGIRRILKQGNLGIKVDIISKMEKAFQTIKKAGENFKPALMLSRDKNGNSVPKDARFTITFDNMPADFYGIQAHVNINLIQGASYPYFYCVIAAKTGFGLEKYKSQIPVPQNVVVSFEKGTAEVIVIRQYTTNTSGYHTKINDCSRIMDTAVKAARIILGDKQQ